MESLAALNTSLLAFGRLLLRNRERGVAAITSSDLPQEVKGALVKEFISGTTDEDAIVHLKNHEAESVRAAAGILQWLYQSYENRRERRSSNTSSLHEHEHER